MTKEIVEVLYARKYDFTNEHGQNYKGTKIVYLPNYVQPDENTHGVMPIEIKAELSFHDIFKPGRALYELNFTIVPGPRGVPRMQLIGAEYVEQVVIKK